MEFAKLIVYLDQNKWIEFARIFHGKDKSDRAISIRREIDASLDCGYVFPLSAFHYIEFARISDRGRRSRLGEVMWKYSGGKTLVSIKEIVEREVEMALQEYIPDIKPRELNLIGKGMVYAFGEDIGNRFPAWLEDAVDEAMLTGANDLDIEPILFFSNKYRKAFKAHLESLQEQKKQLEKSRWDDWLYALTIIDILRPIYDVLNANSIEPMNVVALMAEQGKNIVSKMPTRVLDIHLSHQVLKNSEYKAKLNDLEDWAGLGVAVCYSDIVVCEGHFADMLTRDGYTAHARVETDLANIFEPY